MTAFRIFALSGSLRAESSNTELLRAAGQVAPSEFIVDVFGGMAGLPHFNPDHDREGDILPDRVLDFRERVERSNAMLISSPEYAHGIPGSLKNALDWLVSGPEMVGKPVALIQTTDRAIHAPAQLGEVLRTMSARVLTLSHAVIPFNEQCGAMLRTVLEEIRALS